MRSHRDRSSAQLSALRTIAIGVAIAVSGAVAAQADDTAASAEARTSSALAKAVRNALRTAPGFVAPERMKVDVETSAGTVRVVGRTGTIFDRHHAALIAEGVSGVKSVKGAIRIVRPEKVEPSQLEGLVRAALAAAGAAGADLQVSAKADGTVALNGRVSDEWKALETVRKVVGVTAIAGYDARLPGHAPPPAEGRLEVVPRPKANDALSANVGTALRGAGLDQVGAAADDGRVQLSGHGLESALTAPAVANQVPGVRNVDNQIRSYGVYRKGETPADDELTAEVKRAIRSLRRPDGLRYRLDGLTVRVSSGRVFLSGRLEGARTANAVIAAVAGVRGVEEVVSALSHPPVGGGS